MLLLHHLPADGHRPRRVVLVVAEHHPHVAAEDAAPFGDELPVEVLGLVDAVLGDGRRPGQRGVDADHDLLVGDAVAVVGAGRRGGGWGTGGRGRGRAVRGGGGRRGCGAGGGGDGSRAMVVAPLSASDAGPETERAPAVGAGVDRTEGGSPATAAPVAPVADSGACATTPMVPVAAVAGGGAAAMSGPATPAFWPQAAQTTRAAAAASARSRQLAERTATRVSTPSMTFPVTLCGSEQQDATGIPAQGR